MHKKHFIFLILFSLFATSCFLEADQDDLESQATQNSSDAIEKIENNEFSSVDDQKLVIYSGRKESLVSDIIQEFAETSGVEVEVRYAKSSELAGTLILEGAISPADVFFSQDPISLGTVAKEGLFDRLSENILNNVPEWAVDKNGFWVGISGRSRSLVVDTRVVEDSELPQDIYGLADEKFRNRLGLAPTNSSFIAMIACMIETDGEEKVLDWLTQINELDYKEYPKNSPQVAAAASGELEIGLVNHYYTLRLLSEDPNAPIKNIYLDGGCGAMVMPAGVGILSSSQNKSSAVAFINFLHSKSVQETFANSVYEFPLVSGVNNNELMPDIKKLNSPQNLNWSALSLWQEKAVELIARAGF